MTRGGKRPNSGRKPSKDPLKPHTYKTTDQEDLIIKRWLKLRHKELKERKE